MVAVISTIDVSDAIKAMKRGEKIVTIQPKPVKRGTNGKVEPAKMYKGGQFFNVTYKVNIIGPTGAISTKECKGDFSYKNLKTTKAPLDPNNKEDSRQEFVEEGKTKDPVIESKLSFAGELGEFFMLLQPQWAEEVIRAGASVEGFTLDGQKVRKLMDTHFSKKSKNVELRGTARPDPVLYIKSPAGTYPTTHPEKPLRGMRKSMFYDKSTERIVSDPKFPDDLSKRRYEYDFATYTDESGTEVVVDETNLCKYLTWGSIVDGRLNIGSVSLNDTWISLQMCATKSIVTPGADVDEGEATYEDDMVPMDAVPTVDDSKPVDTNDKPTEPKHEHEPKSDDDKPKENVTATVANAVNPAQAALAQGILDDL